MSFQTINPPAASDFTPLQEHQQQTPGTFFGAKPVLHLHVSNAQLLVSQADLEAQSAFPDLRPSTNASPTNGTSNPTTSPDGRLIIPNIDIWVTSQNLLLHPTTSPTGVSIPYPTISLHAIQRLTLAGPDQQQQHQGLYMQLLLNDTTSTPDDDLLTLELTLVPPAATTPIADLFAAVSACADLNPDPAQDSDSEAEGGQQLEEGLPGAGGWITAENVGECVDAEGNFVGFGGGANGSLGAGAGTVHGREEDGDGEANGHYEDADEGEVVDGGDTAGAGAEETKWRRTE